jgi:hypothetical protein
MIVIVTRTEKITTEVELPQAVYSTKELKEVAIEIAKGQFANNIKQIDYAGNGETYKIRAFV